MKKRIKFNAGFISIFNWLSTDFTKKTSNIALEGINLLFSSMNKILNPSRNNEKTNVLYLYFGK